MEILEKSLENGGLVKCEGCSRVVSGYEVTQDNVKICWDCLGVT